MVFDMQRILADQILLEGLHGLCGRVEKPPGSRFPNPCQSFIRRDPDIQEAIDRQYFDIGDFHEKFSMNSGIENDLKQEETSDQ